MDELRAGLSRLGSAEESLQSKLSGRDRKVAHLEDRLAELQESRSKRMDVVGHVIPSLHVSNLSVPPSS